MTRMGTVICLDGTKVPGFVEGRDVYRVESPRLASMTTTHWPARTGRRVARTSRTTPACGAFTVISIFIDSRTTSSWPACTC